MFAYANCAAQVAVPGARPPTESKHQVVSSALLNKVIKAKNAAVIFPDRNKAWEPAAKNWASLQSQ